MSKKTILVSDLSGKWMETQESVRITITYGDGALPQYVVDAHPDDPEVKRLVESGKKQARRGRQPRTTAS
jgi:hypothetical protein